ncbi:proteasome maturation factor UMP1-domain-containing protein [Entophlyctis helioformis]|nr:proteasome maturation factor UMP1-domain-containing protein [Entophlyctis helioformis]
MSSTLRMVPAALPVQGPAALGRDNAEYGVHDSFRNGLRTLRSEIVQGHPLEARLENWDQTRDQLRLGILRNVYGVAAPLRIQMERALIKQHMRAIPVLHTHNVALDILNGKDDDIEFEDFLGEAKMPTQMMDVHLTMERALGM